MNLGMLGSDIDPEKTAFVSLPQNRHYTYGDIQSISDTVAAGLSRKYQVGDRIAVIVSGFRGLYSYCAWHNESRYGGRSGRTGSKLPDAPDHEMSERRGSRTGFF